MNTHKENQHITARKGSCQQQNTPTNCRTDKSTALVQGPDFALKTKDCVAIIAASILLKYWAREIFTEKKLPINTRDSINIYGIVYII